VMQGSHQPHTAWYMLLSGCSAQGLRRMLPVRRKPYEPVRPATGDPRLHDPSAHESLELIRRADLAYLDHRLEVAKRLDALDKLHHEAGERRTKSTVRMMLLRTSGFIGVASALHTAARWIWEFFYPSDHFDMIIEFASFAVSEICACVCLYLAIRIDKSKSSSSVSERLDERTDGSSVVPPP
jgi:hypothetical protein